MILTSCDYVDNRLTIINNSNKKICFDFDKDTILTIPALGKKEFYMSSYMINPNESNQVSMPGSTKYWDYYINSSKNKKLNLFIFDYDSVVNCNWDSLRKNKRFIKRLEITKAQLDSNNWIVNYK